MYRISSAVTPDVIITNAETVRFQNTNKEFRTYNTHATRPTCITA
ncbi:MAG: hypothetical protein EBU90_04135 [Proteobacteria bacterium]|nr:hypothetical protein [Pseudomonadota bacterium]NBP13918.1 hypothetical protein [bacterium]